MEKSQLVLAEVGTLYLENSAPDMGKWMWRNHVQQVAGRARKLAEKYGADAEKAYCAALIHDLADYRYGRGQKNFAALSEEKGKEVLLKAGFNETGAGRIIEDIVRPHSCHTGDPLPAAIEGKILATADAMWHLQTSFYPMFAYKQRPEKAHSYEAWQDWFDEKIERDFRVKIFFEDERAEVKPYYEALLRVFGNRSLDSKEG